jgi:hypothetical protein
MIPKIHPDYTVNTDQTGCRCQTTGRTLAHEGPKTVLIKNNSMNNIPHMYKAQCAITLSRKTVPCVFLCIEEPRDRFDPLVQNNVDALVKKFKNVIATCSKI